ncbi:MAG TPA: S24/S26 family peptidase [Acetivibrio clariflavus]|nr:S24/S26 family peptidase [Acetivibrio clariflavus]HPU41992.1 S24/S26 family peptidase [Acetivibrio clariflavus]
MNIKKVSTTLDTLSPIILAMLDENIDILMTVTGTSMTPMLRNKRDKVILTSCDKFGLKRGDIPLYRRSNGKYVLHRIVKVNENTYDLCGDNQCEIEKDVPKSSVIAVVKAFERNGKMYGCNDIRYDLYWRFWLLAMPFRRLIQKVRHNLRRRK